MMHDHTTTVLTIDLPGNLGERLRMVIHERKKKGDKCSMRSIALEALEAWLEQNEGASPSE